MQTDALWQARKTRRWTAAVANPLAREFLHSKIMPYGTHRRNERQGIFCLCYPRMGRKHQLAMHRPGGLSASRLRKGPRGGTAGRQLNPNQLAHQTACHPHWTTPHICNRKHLIRMWLKTDAVRCLGKNTNTLCSHSRQTPQHCRILTFAHKCPDWHIARTAMIRMRACAKPITLSLPIDRHQLPSR